MNRDNLSLGSTPADEPCVGVSAPASLQRAECALYREAIEDHFDIPLGCGLRTQGNAHDFGTYYELEGEVRR